MGLGLPKFFCPFSFARLSDMYKKLITREYQLKTINDYTHEFSLMLQKKTHLSKKSLPLNPCTSIFSCSRRYSRLFHTSGWPRDTENCWTWLHMVWPARRIFARPAPGNGKAWWFGARWFGIRFRVPVKIPIPIPFIRKKKPRNPNHRAPTRQLTIS